MHVVIATAGNHVATLGIEFFNNDTSHMCCWPESGQYHAKLLFRKVLDACSNVPVNTKRPKTWLLLILVPHAEHIILLSQLSSQHGQHIV